MDLPCFLEFLRIEPFVSSIDNQMTLSTLDTGRILNRCLFSWVSQKETFRSYPFQWAGKLQQILLGGGFPKRASTSRTFLSIGFGRPPT